MLYFVPVCCYKSLSLCLKVDFSVISFQTIKRSVKTYQLFWLHLIIS